MDYPLQFVWKNSPTRAALYRQRCRIVARGTMNSVLVEFADGLRHVVSRYAVRKVKTH